MDSALGPVPFLTMLSRAVGQINRTVFLVIDKKDRPTGTWLVWAGSRQDAAETVMAYRSWLDR